MADNKQLLELTDDTEAASASLDAFFAAYGQQKHEDVPKRAPETPRRDQPMPRPRPAQPASPPKGIDWGDWLARLGMVGGVFLIVYALLCGFSWSPLRDQPAAQPVRHLTAPQPKTMDIEDVRVGMRLMGNNPRRELVDPNAPEPNPETWRQLVLRMKKESGRRLDVNLLRELDWIKAAHAFEGGTFVLDLPEMGAVGDAYVISIGPCPEVKPGPGNVVTGTFHHEADPDTRILSVTFANGAYIRGVTDNHPLFSVDANDFVPIGEMQEGDFVRTIDGVTRITKFQSRFAHPGEMLYNVETHNEHVYQVTTAGILVHNSCVTLYKAPQPHYNVDDIARNGLRKDMFPGEGAFFTTDPKIAHKYARNYQNGVHEFRVSRAEYDRLVADGKIVVDPSEVNSLIVRPDGIDAFNSATTSRRWIDQLSQDFWNLFGAP